MQRADAAQWMWVELIKQLFLSSVAKDLGFHYAFAIKWQSETIGEALNYPENLQLCIVRIQIEKACYPSIYFILAPIVLLLTSPSTCHKHHLA